MLPDLSQRSRPVMPALQKGCQPGIVTLASLASATTASHSRAWAGEKRRRACRLLKLTR